MQDLRMCIEQPTRLLSSSSSSSSSSSLSSSSLSSSFSHNRRQVHLLTQMNSNYKNTNNIIGQHSHSPSSEEDNSPTEMNNCRRLLDKPPLVKRLTMGMSLLRGTEDSRPLMHTTTASINPLTQTMASDGYVNEAICEADKLLTGQFEKSCRQSLTALETLKRLQQGYNEFNCNKQGFRKACNANSNLRRLPNIPLHFESLSLAEQNELKGTPWFQAGIPREISLEVLSRQNPGAFLVRQSTTKPGCFALSLRVPPPAPKVAHYLILRTSSGYKIKGFTKEFTSLRALITHHSVMPELLPVPLSLPRSPNANGNANSHSNNSTTDHECNNLNSVDSDAAADDFVTMA